MVSLNQVEIMIMGGYQGNSDTINDTFIFNYESQTWIVGPKFITSRRSFSAEIISDFETRDQSVIVVAGYDDKHFNYLSSVEIMKLSDRNQWIQGK